MKPVISIGNQDFRSIRENHNFYVDKSDFIREWWENQDTVTLITRPRRFGKTLNMSMLENFFSIQNEKREDLFEGLAIWEDQKYRALQGSYPVIFLSFASVKGETYPEAREGIIQIILDLYTKYDYLRLSDKLSEKEKAYFDFIKSDMSNTIAAMSLHRLALCMNRYYGKKVLILLDEYDTPLQEAPDGFLTADPNDTIMPFGSGECAMDIQGQWYDGTLIQNDLPVADYGVFSFPSGETNRMSAFAEMTQFNANLTDEELDACVKFMDCYYDDENVSNYGEYYITFRFLKLAQQLRKNSLTSII